MPETTTPPAAASADPGAAPPAAPATPGASPAAPTPDPKTAAPAKAGAAATVLTDDGKGATPPAAADWRTAFGADEKTQKLLARYSSAEAFGRAHLEAVGRISGIKSPLKEGASADEIKAWRTDNGIPAEVGGYFEKLPGGLVIGEDDKALFGEWAGKMHALNAPPSYVHETVKWYYAMQEQQKANEEAMDRQHQTESKTALRTAWGPEYTENINLLESFMGGLPEETRGMFMDATMPDGRRLFNSPEIIQWLTQKAREINPLAIIPPAGGGDEGKTLDERIAAIEATMGTQAYIKNDKIQAELRKLYERREQLRERGQAA